MITRKDIGSPKMLAVTEGTDIPVTSVLRITAQFRIDSTLNLRPMEEAMIRDNLEMQILHRVYGEIWEAFPYLETEILKLHDPVSEFKIFKALDKFRAILFAPKAK